MSFTEAFHPKTQNIDKVSIEEGILMFVDAFDEVFYVMNSTGKIHIKTLSKVFEQYKDSKKIIAGSGTSARLSNLFAKKYDNIIPLVAGGPTALLKAKEGAEDRPLLGIRDFRNENVKEGYFIDVSCSAKDQYSAGPMYDIIKNHMRFDSYVITFNDIDHMPEENLPGLDASIKTLVQQARLLNPKIGPEPIAGSTRMKGGTATQLMLEAAINKHFGEYSWNKNLTSLPEIITDAVDSLKNHSHLYYIGENNLGIIAVMDAAECMPTFGTKFEDVRAYISHGWHGLLSRKQLLQMDDKFVEKYPIDISSFKDIVGDNDTVLSMGNTSMSSKLESALTYANRKGAKTHILAEDDEISLKILLNIISTETFIQLGHTYKNLMINLRLSNQKLINRAVNMIIPEVYEDITGKIPEKEMIMQRLNYVAGKYLHKALSDKSLYGSEVYYEVDKIVPTTLLVMLGMDYASAVTALDKEVHIRDVLNKNL